MSTNEKHIPAKGDVVIDYMLMTVMYHVSAR